MNELTSVFQYGGNELQTIIKNGEPWFVAKDVCKILEIKNVSDAVSKLNKNFKTTIGLTDTGSNYKTNALAVNEAGLYKLVFKSRKEEAEKFSDWVAEEILPSIRKNGAYMTEQTLEKALTNPDFLIQLATQLKEEKTKLKTEQEKTAILEQQIAEYEPKVNYLDTILNSKDTVLISQIADDYGLTGQKMNKLLHKHGIQYKANDQWLLYAKHKGQGYTKSKPIDILHNDGSYSVKLNTRWTQKGRLFIYETLKSHNILPLMDIQLNKQSELAGVSN